MLSHPLHLYLFNPSSALVYSSPVLLISVWKLKHTACTYFLLMQNVQLKLTTLLKYKCMPSVGKLHNLIMALSSLSSSLVRNLLFQKQSFRYQVKKSAGRGHLKTGTESSNEPDMR
jgi:hypothetical protein